MAFERSREVRQKLQRAAAGTVSCLLGAIALAGCTPSESPIATPTPTAIFASEEEALAAATDVYQRYNAAFDSASSKGSEDMSGMQGLVTDAHLKELGKPGTIDSNGWHTEGSSSFDVKEVASYIPGIAETEIALNVCRYLSEVKVVDAEGIDVTPSDWPDYVPLVISFVSSDSDPASLLISKVDSWLEPHSC